MLDLIWSFFSNLFNPTTTNKREETDVEKELTLFEHVKSLYLQYGAEWSSVNIFGIRDTSNMTEDVYNDYIGVAIDGEVYLYRATTDPGVYYTKNRLNKKGVAHLCLGFYKNAYVIGYHLNRYEALVQRNAPVKVWRDANENFENDDNIIEEGYFGINIHKGSDTEKIGRDSAGCQAIRTNSDFKEFMTLVKSKNKNTFSYMLFSKNDFPFEIEI